MGRFKSKPVPAGWHCSAIGDNSTFAKLGQCTPKRRLPNGEELDDE